MTFVYRRRKAHETCEISSSSSLAEMSVDWSWLNMKCAEKHRPGLHRNDCFHSMCRNVPWGSWQIQYEDNILRQGVPYIHYSVSQHVGPQASLTISFSDFILCSRPRVTGPIYGKAGFHACNWRLASPDNVTILVVIFSMQAMRDSSVSVCPHIVALPIQEPFY